MLDIPLQGKSNILPPRRPERNILNPSRTEGRGLPPSRTVTLKLTARVFEGPHVSVPTIDCHTTGCVPHVGLSLKHLIIKVTYFSSCVTAESSVVINLLSSCWRGMQHSSLHDSCYAALKLGQGPLPALDAAGVLQHPFPEGARVAAAVLQISGRCKLPHHTT